MRLRTVHALVALAAVLTLCGNVAATPIYDEAIQGDLSGLFTAPTLVTLIIGQSEIVGATGAGAPGDPRDYFTFTIPTGTTLTSLKLVSSSLGSGLAAFMGLAAGPAFPFDPAVAASHLGDFLGYSHFSPADNGSNLLPLLAAGPGAKGLPGLLLGPGQYTIWIQDTSGGVSNYDLIADVVPEPGTLLLMLSGLGVLRAAHRRRTA